MRPLEQRLWCLANAIVRRLRVPKPGEVVSCMARFRRSGSAAGVLVRPGVAWVGEVTGLADGGETVLDRAGCRAPRRVLRLPRGGLRTQAGAGSAARPRRRRVG